MKNLGKMISQVLSNLILYYASDLLVQILDLLLARQACSGKLISLFLSLITDKIGLIIAQCEE